MKQRFALAAVALTAMLFTGCNGSKNAAQLKMLASEHKIQDIQKQEADLNNRFQAINVQLQAINGEFPEMGPALKQAQLDWQKKVAEIYAKHGTTEKDVQARISAVQAKQTPLTEQFAALDAQLKQAAAELQAQKEEWAKKQGKPLDLFDLDTGTMEFTAKKAVTP